jgi:hypothetical protein
MLIRVGNDVINLDSVTLIEPFSEPVPGGDPVTATRDGGSDIIVGFSEPVPGGDPVTGCRVHFVAEIEDYGSTGSTGMRFRDYRGDAAAELLSGAYDGACN